MLDDGEPARQGVGVVTALVCPHCKSPDHLATVERAYILQPASFHHDSDGDYADFDDRPVRIEWRSYGLAHICDETETVGYICLDCNDEWPIDGPLPGPVPFIVPEP